MSDGAPSVRVRRARIEEIRELARQYRDESADRRQDGPRDASLPPGGIFWIAEDADDGRALGYAAGQLAPEGITIGPVYVRPDDRRRRVGQELLREIQRWAESTRVPVVEVSVAVDNDTGRAFLEATGYVPRRILFSHTPHAQDDQRG